MFYRRCLETNKSCMYKHLVLLLGIPSFINFINCLDNKLSKHNTKLTLCNYKFIMQSLMQHHCCMNALQPISHAFEWLNQYFFSFCNLQMSHPKSCYSKQEGAKTRPIKIIFDTSLANVCWSLHYLWSCNWDWHKTWQL